MIDLIQVTIVRDDSSHWYIIPVKLREEFNRLLDLEEEGEAEFINKFTKYMTGGSFNLMNIYVTKEDLENL